ncbi:MAG: hypothetical protein ACR2NU_15225 [Aeoliella sp.]
MTKTLTSFAVLLVATFVFVGNSAQAEGIKIFLQGIDIAYDSGTGLIEDIGAPLDSVHTVEITDDGSLAYGPDDGTVDIAIPGIVGIPVGGGTVSNGGGGVFDITFGAGGVDGFLALDLSTAFVTYTAGVGIDIFGASIASIGGQALPAGLTAKDPVSVSFSTETETVTDNGSTLLTFTASSGTAEVFEVIPEPSSLGILALGGLLAGMGAIRYCLG